MELFAARQLKIMQSVIVARGTQQCRFWAIDKSRKMEHFATFWNIPEHQKLINIGTQGVQGLFFVNNKYLEVVNNVCQLMVSAVWSVESDWSVKP